MAQKKHEIFLYISQNSIPSSLFPQCKLIKAHGRPRWKPYTSQPHMGTTLFVEGVNFDGHSLGEGAQREFRL